MIIYTNLPSTEGLKHGSPHVIWPSLFDGIDVYFTTGGARAETLETPATYCDQTGVGRQEENRVVDVRDGHLEAVSLLNEGPYTGTPKAGGAGVSEGA